MASREAHTDSTSSHSSPRTLNSTPEVQLEKQNSRRTFVLNRPKALNALNLPMIETIRNQLEVWLASEHCSTIVLTKSEGSKAFCAGGDVKQVIRVAEEQGVPAAMEFFDAEYRLNHLIGTATKPIISIMDGITMGGGVGLSVHAPFRIATENTVFAMPETAIGFFPDVGGSFFLSRLDGSLGAYLGLTGHRLKGEEVLLAGIATHYVPSARLNSLLNRLSELDTEEIDVINAAIEEFVGDPSLKTWQNWRLGGEVGQAVDRCFSKGTLEEIVEALEKEGTEWSRETLDTLKKMSPTSLKVSLRQIQIGRRKTFAECFQLERWLAKRLLEIKTDFHEGVKAKLVEKREPAWLPSWDDKGNITPALLDSFFFDEKKMRADKDHPELSNRTTFYEYPHRTLSGLPTRMDITNVVYGQATRISHEPPKTKAELLEWFEQHWGGYDESVIGSIQGRTPITSNIDNGFGRGKVGLRERVITLMERFVVETPSGLVFKP